MACASESSLQRFLEGTLSPPAAAALEEHLGACDVCRQTLAEAAKATLPDDPAAPSASGARAVGRYVVEKPIGAGGMGVVYAAHDPQLERKVALKLLRTSVFKGMPEARELVLREARAMAKLSHPNVITVFDAGELDGHLFVAMELIEGATAAAWLKEKPRSTAEVLDVFVAAARGLEAAHAAGLVHRDFKPDNVLVGSDGRVRVTDFGLALPASAREGASGSPPYMAPEQRAGEPADARADVYSFCVALHEALAGERPVAGALSPRVPRALRDVLASGLSSEPAKRTASMDEVRRQIERAVARPRRILGAVVAATALVLLAALIGLLVAQRREISALSERKADLDRRIVSTLAEMQRETQPDRLFQLEQQLETLSGSAEQVSGELSAKGAPQSRQAPLDRHIRELLHRFGAETYAVPPIFKDTLRLHIDRIRRSKGLSIARERMAVHLSVIERELKALDLPRELAFVPYVESHFDPQARSPMGAAGIWQFIPSTARKYGLRVDEQLDERLDVAKSSKAAAAYLSTLLAEFGSDSFMLAIASYNLGEFQMRKVLRELAREPGGLRREKRDFWHLYRRKLLTAEAREYVPGVLAAAIVFTHPDQYLVERPDDFRATVLPGRAHPIGGPSRP